MIRLAKLNDIECIVNLFVETIKNQKSYISHGEIQMGIATEAKTLSDNFIIKWKDYLKDQLKENGDNIFVFEDNNEIIGFIIGSIDRDRDVDFGVICDIVVHNNYRKKGIGNDLLKNLLDHFNKKGIKDIYLESGVNNHDAHCFFEKRGFLQISHIYHRSIRLKN